MSGLQQAFPRKFEKSLKTNYPMRLRKPISHTQENSKLVLISPYFSLFYIQTIQLTKFRLAINNSNLKISFINCFFGIFLPTSLFWLAELNIFSQKVFSTQDQTLFQLFAFHISCDITLGICFGCCHTTYYYI